MITIHPQRWSDDLFIWMWEYGTQTVKNGIKRLIFVQMRLEAGLPGVVVIEGHVQGLANARALGRAGIR